MNTSTLQIHVRSFNEDERYIEGIATTPTVDRMGDIVDPLGARFEKEIPLLLDHDSKQRVGRVQLQKPTKAGIPFKAWIPKVTEEGLLKQRVDLAWQEVKYGLLKTTSIGFSILDDAIEKIATGYRFLKTEILELSLVPIPAQSEARIQYFKSMASTTPAAPGNGSSSNPLPVRAGTNPSTRGKAMNVYTQESLAALQDARRTKAARMAELREVKTNEGRSFTDDERAEFNGLDSEIENLDDDIKVTQRHVGNIATARSVEQRSNGAAPYGFVKRADPDDKFKGQAGTRMVIAKALAAIAAKNGSFLRPSDIAEMRWGKTNPQLVAVIKANEVPGGGTGSGEWGAELVSVDNRYTGDFIEYLYNQTAFDKLPLREVPANVGIKGQDGQFTGYWVGQSKAIPMSGGDFSNTSTAPLKVAAITVLSNELIEDSSPAAEQIVRDALSEALTQRIDTTFFSAAAAVSGVSPAGILNGVSAVAASNGPDAQSVATDFRALLGAFITAKNVRGLYVVTTPSNAAALGLMRNALGQLEFPGLSAEGGTFNGYPVVVGDNVGTGDVIMLNPREIWKIGDSGLRITASTEAMIEQSSAPTGATDTPTAASQAFTSMYQEESTAIKVVRRINFGKRRTSAVAWIDDAAYGGETS